MSDKETEGSKLQWLPFILPHELLDQIVAASRGHNLVDLPSSDAGLQRMKTDWCKHLKVPDRRTIPMGFHGDGVPHQVKSSLFVFSWNLLAKPDAERYPFSMVEKEWLCL